MDKDDMEKRIQYLKVKILSVAIGVSIFIIELFVIFRVMNINQILFLLIAFSVIAIFLVCAIKYYIYLKNKIIKEDNDTNEIYVRDIPPNYSPALVSYLFNQKIEKKKDLIATIINICAKGAININFKDNNGVEIIDLGIINNLLDDEKYIYECLTNNKKNSYYEWEEIIINTYNNEQLSNKNHISLSEITTFIMICSIILLAISSSFNINFYGFYDILMFVFFILFPINIVFGVYDWIKSEFFKDKIKNHIYTSKGATEIRKWEKLKRYIKDFSLIKEKELQSVSLWNQYLAYAIALNVNKNYNEVDSDVINKFLKFDIVSSLNNYLENIEMY